MTKENGSVFFSHFRKGKIESQGTSGWGDLFDCFGWEESRSGGDTEFTSGCRILIFSLLHIEEMLSLCILLNKILKQGAGKRKSLAVTICK